VIGRLFIILIGIFTKIIKMRRIKLYLLGIFLLLGCNNETIPEVILGSWVSIHSENAIYEEIYINDSLFFYCNNLSMGLIPLKYKILNDSIILYNEIGNVANRYKIEELNRNRNQLIFTLNEDSIVLNRLNLSLKFLDSVFINEEKMDTFLFNFNKRSQMNL
jgi:hypothetical protein